MSNATRNVSEYDVIAKVVQHYIDEIPPCSETLIYLAIQIRQIC